MGRFSGRVKQTPWSWKIEAFVTFICGAFVVIGIGVVTSQERKLRNAIEIPAVVDEAFVRRSESKKSGSSKSSSTYEPVVKFHFVLNGKRYDGRDVHPLTIAASSEWANGVIAAYQPGKKVTARVVPSDPTNAYLEPLRQFFPTLITMIGCLVYIIVVGSSRANAKPPLGTRGRVVIAWGIGTALLLWFVIVNPSVPTDALVTSLVWAAITGVLVFVNSRRRRTAETTA